MIGAFLQHRRANEIPKASRVGKAGQFKIEMLEKKFKIFADKEPTRNSIIKKLS